MFLRRIRTALAALMSRRTPAPAAVSLDVCGGLNGLRAAVRDLSTPDAVALLQRVQWPADALRGESWTLTARDGGAVRRFTVSTTQTTLVHGVPMPLVTVDAL